MASSPDGGYVRIYRRILENPVFRDHGEAMAFAYLVLLASWRPARVRYKDRQVELKRGQLAISVRDLAAKLDRSRSWCDRFLTRLTDRDMIGTDSGTGVNIITICNYEEYQAPKEDGETPSEPKAGHHRDSAGTQNKEGNKGKKEDTPPTPSLPEWLPMAEWEGWLDMRRRKKVPNSPRALAMAIHKLDELRRKGFDPARMLDEHTLRGWQGIYDPGRARGDDMRKQTALTL